MMVFGTSSGRLVAALMLFPFLAAAEGKSANPKRLILGVDVSASITRDQRQSWLPVAQSFLACLGAGDALEIFLIHENTRDSAPLFVGSFPVKRGSTIKAMQEFVSARKAFREQADAALNRAFSPDVKANVTDIFSLLDRVHPDGRPVRLVLFTDGFHSTSELNLEKVRLNPEHFSELVRAEAQRHKWHNQTLTHTQVDMILPSVGCCTKVKPVNDRIVLEQFYQQLVAALGGRAGAFDTHVGVN